MKNLLPFYIGYVKTPVDFKNNEAIKEHTNMNKKLISLPLAMVFTLANTGCTIDEAKCFITVNQAFTNGKSCERVEEAKIKEIENRLNLLNNPARYNKGAYEAVRCLVNSQYPEHAEDSDFVHYVKRAQSMVLLGEFLHEPAKLRWDTAKECSENFDVSAEAFANMEECYDKTKATHPTFNTFVQSLKVTQTLNIDNCPAAHTLALK